MDAVPPDKKLVRVIIFQHPYTLRSSGESGDTENLAHVVDELMTQIATRTSGADPTRIAVLACLHLADKVRHLERDASALQGRLEELDHKLADLLD